MAAILFGFGGCKFEKSGYTTATFSGGTGTPIYTPIQIMKENVGYDVISRLKGYRLTLEISALYNVDSDDYIQYQYLAQILTALVDSDTQQTLTLTPRDDSTITPPTYECILTSPVTPADLHRIKIGQVMALSFTCITMQDTIPSIVSDTTAQDYWDGTDQYVDDGADQYIDNLG